jgi:hypothetical protein
VERERQRRRRRFVAIGTLAALVVVAAAAAWLARDRPPPRRPLPEDVRAGSEEIADRGELRIRGLTEAYRIVYRVDDFAGGEHNVTTDDIRVGRPFDSRIERRRGEPPGDEVTFTQIVTFGRLTVPASGTTRAAVVDASPDLASGDLRFDIGLPAALDADLVEAREWRRVHDRPCRIYRTGGPVGTGVVTAYDPDATEYADICVDADGFMLEEVWVSDGRALRRKLVTRIEEGEPIPPRLLEHDGEPIPADQGGGSVREVAADSPPPGRSWFARSVPEGLSLRGRYAVVPAQPELVEEENRDRRRASIVDVWTGGVDLLVIDQGGTLGGVTIFQQDPLARRVEVGDFGEADAIADFRLNEVRILLDGGRWVRIRGTYPLDELVDVGRHLELVESETNQLIYLDEAPPDTEITGT